MYYSIIIKFIIMAVSFYYIRKLPIPDSYKFVLTIIPALLMLSANYMIKQIKYSGQNKPLTVKRDDGRSDVMVPEDFFYEPFTSFANRRNALFVSKENEFTMEVQKNADAKLYENEPPYWIQSGGYLDISNPNNFIKIDNLKLTTNYTLEFWLRLKYVSNNNIAKFYKDDVLLFEIIYDDKFIYVNQSTKIPIINHKWAHIVIMRGKTDTIGSDRGSIYVNGIFFGYIDVLPNLQSMNNVYLFKNSNAPNEYNKHYHDLSNCALVRMYSRSLNVDEIQNNYLKDASYFGLLEEQNETFRTYVNDNLVFYLECRVSTPPILDKTVDSSIRSIDVVQTTQLKKIKKPEPLYRIDDSKANVISIYSDDMIPNKPLEIIHNISKPAPQQPDQIIIIDSSDSDGSTKNDWLQKAKKEHKKEQKKEKKQIKIQEEAVKLENNWLDGKPKKEDTEPEDKKEDEKEKKDDKKDDKKEKKDDKKEDKKEDKKDDKKEKKEDKKEKKEKTDEKDVKEVKTSKPIF